MRADLAETISAKLIDLMEKHGSNWRQPWTGSGLYRNAVSKKPYRGINQLIAATSGYAEPWFATYKQWRDLGAQVRKGEKATAIFFFKPFNVKDKDTEQEKQIMLARTYSVFNVVQVDNPPPLEIATRPEIERHAECDQIIVETGQIFIMAATARPTSRAKTALCSRRRSSSRTGMRFTGPPFTSLATGQEPRNA